MTLHNGKVVKGALASMVLKKKPRRDAVSWSGKLSGETDSGVLEMDGAGIKSITAA